MPFPEKAVEILRWKRDVSKGGRVVKKSLAALKSDEANRIQDVKLKDVATIIEGLVTVRSPHDPFHMNHFSKSNFRNIKIAFLRSVGVGRIAKCVGYSPRIRFDRERHVVSATSGNTPLDFIERTGKHRAVGRAPTV